ncbi:MAG: TIGR02646 family protein [Desulfuromonadales bacterium]|nr:TIGR02646 family protein [Desulfuromonadales bacterium]
MKHILKGAEPQVFTNWKSLANEDWQPTYSVLSGDTKRVVKEALMAEQCHICCYCERRLSEDDSHIEHFRPQSDPVVDPLDFGNLLCSCQVQVKKGEPRHCGNLKEDWFDPDLLVSPVDSSCEERFVFEGDGLIKPAAEQDAAAAETIKKLGLDIPKLNSLRRKVIEPFLDDRLSNEEFQAFVSGYLDKDTAGRFGEFWTTIRYLFGGIVAA